MGEDEDEDARALRPRSLAGMARAIGYLLGLGVVALGLLWAVDFHWLGGVGRLVEPARAAVFGAYSAPLER